MSQIHGQYKVVMVSKIIAHHNLAKHAERKKEQRCGSTATSSTTRNIGSSEHSLAAQREQLFADSNDIYPVDAVTVSF